MIRTGFIGGRLGYSILRFISRRAAWTNYCNGSAYRGRSKVEALFGPEIWTAIRGKVVIDFGCGIGKEAIEIAQHGAKKVIGIEIQQNYLVIARRLAEWAGVAQRCRFTTHTSEKADVILSVDGFEHYENPAKILKIMRGLVKDDGRILISFGPPWFHPLGGHLFTVFPWAHLIFTEKALIRWRSDFTSDGAARFSEVAGGLNQMTIRRFRKLLAESDFHIECLEAVPIKKLRFLSNCVTREFLTSIVGCRLVPRTPMRADCLAPPIAVGAEAGLS